jgi:hypothetical protein
MDQQSIVMYLSLKDLNAVEIQKDLIATLKGEGMSHALPYCALGEARRQSEVRTHTAGQREA